MRQIVAGLAAFLLTACAGSAIRNAFPEEAPKLTDQEAKEALVPLICYGQEQCSSYWKKSQVWIARNSQWKIQTLTDALLITYAATTGFDGRVSYKLMREPQEKGSERIWIEAYCVRNYEKSHNCSQNPMALTLAFKRYVADPR